VNATRGVRVGDPADDATEMGPLISAQHRETVASFVNGDVLFSGETPSGPGYWFPATLVEASNEGPHRARGGLRARRGAHPVRGRGRRGCGSQRHAVRPLGLDLDARRRPRAARRARARDRRPVGQLEHSVRARRRSAASSSRLRRELGMHALEGYSEVKNVFFDGR
jgi:hypothetical protein